MLSSIPSPSDGTLSIGPLSIHAYGLMIALGVIAAVWLAGRRLEKMGAGTRDQFTSVAMWAVFAGVVGSRIYYIITDKTQPWKHPEKWLQIWTGGLGIPGGLIAGVAVGVWVVKRKGISVPATLTAAAPAIPLAQAIGRWGNWWNQELFGRPTTLPWGLEIDDAHLPSGYASGTLFHPTFLYESLWNFALCGVLLLIDRKVRLRPGRLMGVYVLGYSVGRFWVEGLRIDPANSGGGWRLNQWTAVVFGAGALLYLVVDHVRHRGEPVPEPDRLVPAHADGDTSTGDPADAVDGDLTPVGGDAVPDAGATAEDSSAEGP